jgi:hypothetical protein
MLSKAGDFRRAIESRDFSAAEDLLMVLRSEFEALWHTSTKAERARLSAETLDLLHWARVVALVHRSHVHLRLTQTRQGHAYLYSQSARTRVNLEV